MQCIAGSLNTAFYMISASSFYPCFQALQKDSETGAAAEEKKDDGPEDMALD